MNGVMPLDGEYVSLVFNPYYSLSIIHTGYIAKLPPSIDILQAHALVDRIQATLDCSSTPGITSVAWQLHDMESVTECFPGCYCGVTVHPSPWFWSPASP